MIANVWLQSIQLLMNPVTVITFLSIAIVFVFLRPIYMKDIVNYQYKVIADILAFLFLSWVVASILGLILAMHLAP